MTSNDGTTQSENRLVWELNSVLAGAKARASLSSLTKGNRHHLRTSCISCRHDPCSCIALELHLVCAEHPDATPKGNRRHLGVSWTPFSCGPRNCIGQSLALQELRTVLSVFLSRFKFELPGEACFACCGCCAKPQHGFVRSVFTRVQHETCSVHAARYVLTAVCSLSACILPCLCEEMVGHVLQDTTGGHLVTNERPSKRLCSENT